MRNFFSGLGQKEETKIGGKTPDELKKQADDLIAMQATKQKKIKAQKEAEQEAKEAFDEGTEEELPVEALDVPSGTNVKVKFPPETVKQIEKSGMDAKQVLARTKAVVGQEAVREGIKRVLAANPNVKDLVIEIGPDGKPTLYEGIPSLMRNAYRVTHIPERKTKVKGSNELLSNLYKKIEKMVWKGEGHVRSMSQRGVLDTLQKEDPARYGHLTIDNIKNYENVIRKRNPNRRAPKVQ